MVHLGYFWPIIEKVPNAMSRGAKHVKNLGTWCTPPPWNCIPYAPRTLFTFGPWIDRANHPSLAEAQVDTGSCKNLHQVVEAVPLGKTTGYTVSRFIKENIICRFGIPKMIMLDNGTPFINQHVERLLCQYAVDHRTSSTYYPLGNG